MWLAQPRNGHHCKQYTAAGRSWDGVHHRLRKRRRGERPHAGRPVLLRIVPAVRCRPSLHVEQPPEPAELHHDDVRFDQRRDDRQRSRRQRLDRRCGQHRRPARRRARPVACVHGEHGDAVHDGVERPLLGTPRSLPLLRRHGGEPDAVQPARRRFRPELRERSGVGPVPLHVDHSQHVRRHAQLRFVGCRRSASEDRDPDSGGGRLQERRRHLHLVR